MLCALRQTASCMPDGAVAHKIGSAAAKRAGPWQGVRCTQSIKLTVVSLAEIHLSAVFKNRNSVQLYIPCTRTRSWPSMAQPDQASAQLKQYLAQFAPQVRGRLLAELERLHALGDNSPRTEELIALLRAEFRGNGQGPERIGDPARVFFQPLEPVLIDSAPERANSGQIARGSLAPIWALL